MKRTLLLLCCLLIAPTLRAETLTAAGDPWLPYLGPRLPEEGLSARIVREAFRREGFEVEIRFMPWARAIRSVRRGSVDLLVATWWTRERAKFLHFSQPYVRNEIKFIKLKDSPFAYEGLESLAGKRIGLVRDYGYGDAFTQATHYQQVDNPSLLANIRMLLAGRIDLTLEDELVARYTLARDAPEALERIAFVPRPLTSHTLHVSSGLAHPDHRRLIDAFNRGLASMKADGTYRRMLEPLQPLP